MSVDTSYWDKLKDPRWQQMRLKVFERDNWQCQLCGETSETLHVHHGHYRRDADPWEYVEKTLHTVCQSCHEYADDLRCDLQLVVAKLPLVAQEDLFHLVRRLNELEPADINYLLQVEFAQLLSEQECNKHGEN